MKSFEPNNMMKIGQQERVKNIFFCFVPGPATDNSGLSIWLLRKNSVQGGAIVHNLHRNNLHRKKASTMKHPKIQGCIGSSYFYLKI